MKFTKQQTNLFYRIQRKHKVSLEFLTLNFGKVIKLYKYLKNIHVVIKRKLIIKNFRAIIKYNQLRKQLFHNPPNYNKRTLSWTKRILLQRKRKRLQQKFDTTKEKSENIIEECNETEPFQEDIQKKLKEQLELLKSGKRLVPLIEKSIVKQQNRKFNFTSIENTQTDFKANLLKCRDIVQNDDVIKERFTKNLEPVKLNGTGILNEMYLKSPLKKGKFLDSLIYKLTNDSANKFPVELSSKDVTKKKSDTPSNFPTKYDSQKNNDSIASPLYETDSTSSSDFLGFNESDLMSGNIPGMLPTPVVSKGINNAKSAFISEDLENFMRENSLENSANVEFPKKRNYEEGLVCDGAPPPKMIMPVIPDELVKPRTVAEKRSILKKRKSIKYWMIENENTIYRELKKRSKSGTVNVNLLQCIQNSTVPFTRDCWKACTWLCTKNGNFYFQILKVDGIEVKLIGGRGNHPIKYMGEQQSKPFKASSVKHCPIDCWQNENFKNIRINNTDICDILKNNKHNGLGETDLKMKIHADKQCVKPGPLSKKCKFNFDESVNSDSDQIEIFNMPQIQMEVFPEINKPLDDFVKPYLKMILPSTHISREWAEFAVSTLVTKQNNDSSCQKRESFTFNIPYLNGQKNLLVRKLFKRSEIYEKPINSTEEFQFLKNAHLTDEIGSTCREVLAEMIDSVALGLSEDCLIYDDPDIDYPNNNKVNAITTNEDNIKLKSTVKKRTAKDKLMSELKRLNATVIDAECLYNIPVTTQKECTESYCNLGCVCHSLTNSSVIRKHCKKIDCMFECICNHNDAVVDRNLGKLFSPQDAFLIREKATARLAKVEKEFCSTVVLTDNETFLINESQTDRKRHKKMPKRYHDYINNGDKNEISHENQTNLKLNIPSSKYSVLDDNLASEYKHCTVDLCNLTILANIETWCMVHCLYKCFCNCTALSGEPFEIKKEEAITEEEIVYTRKRRYSFDKDDGNSEYDRKTKRQKYINGEPNSCCRTNIVPVQLYRTINKTRLPKVLKAIKIEEIQTTKYLKKKGLEYIAQICKKYAIYNHTDDAKILNEQNQPKSTSPDINVDTEYNLCPTFIAKHAQQHNSVPPLRKNNKKISSVESTSQNVHLNPIAQNTNLQVPNEKALYLKTNLENQSVVRPFLSQLTNVTSKNISKDNLNSNANDIKTPIITSVCSLNTLIEQPISEFSYDICIKDNDTFNIIMNNKQIANVVKSKEFHGNAIKKLNLAVTKTMHSICNIQKKNTKNIPPPVPNTLSSHQWKFFLQAYIERIIFVWEIKVHNKSIIAATNRNIMPLVPSALSVVNIKAIRRENLPLIGKMLNGKIINDKTKTLSVLMTGYHNYWRIIGFLNSTSDYLKQGCVVKPTPKSHPRLSQKINILYKMLIVREVKALTQSCTGNNENDQQKYLPVQANRKKFESIEKYQMPASNISIKRVTPMEVDSIFVPIPVRGNHRWLMLTLMDDFSHIYIPAWHNFLSHDKIKKAITLATKSNKTVRLGQGTKQDISNVDVYATPGHLNRIYFGPFEFMKELDIVLYQNVDGRMLLREDFERSQNITRNKSSTGCWLYMKNDQLLFEQHQKNNSEIIDKNNKDLLDDDECFIITDDEKSIITTKTKVQPEKSVKDLQTNHFAVDSNKNNDDISLAVRKEIKTNNLINPMQKKKVLIPKTMLLKPCQTFEMFDRAGHKSSTENRNSTEIKLNLGKQMDQPTNISANITEKQSFNQKFESAFKLAKKLPSSLIIIPPQKSNSQKIEEISRKLSKVDDISISLRNEKSDNSTVRQVQVPDKNTPNVIRVKKLFKKSTSNTCKNVIPSTSTIVSNESLTQNSIDSLNTLVTSPSASSINNEGADSAISFKPIPGFIISHIVQLGKIPAYKLPDGYALRMPNFKGTVKIRTLDMIERYIAEYLRLHIKQFVPKDLHIGWYFVPAGGEGRKYELHDKNILEKDMIISKNGLFSKIKNFNDRNDRLVNFTKISSPEHKVMAIKILNKDKALNFDFDDQQKASIQPKPEVLKKEECTQIKANDMKRAFSNIQLDVQAVNAKKSRSSSLDYSEIILIDDDD